MNVRIVKRKPLKPSYAVFSDESGIDDNNRYASISMVSIRFALLYQYLDELQGILQERKIEELKWTDLKGHSSKIEVAKSFIDYAIGKKGNLRIKTLIWDKHDSRHQVERIDKNKNIQKMYFKLGCKVFKNWEDTVQGHDQMYWNLYPDRGTSIDFEEVKRFHNASAYKTAEYNGYSKIPAFQVCNFLEQDSHTCPLIQLADLFAGLARFAREERQVEQTNRQQAQSGVLDYLLEQKDLRLEQSQGGIKGGGRFINFWNYEPQGSYDKAPVRIKDLQRKGVAK